MTTTKRNNRLGLLKVIVWTALAFSISDAVCRAQPGYPCGHSTVDDNHDPAYSSEAKSFLSKLQAMVKANDRAQFATLAHYPLRINGADTSHILKPEDLIRKYPKIVTPNVKHAIFSQSPNCLFANGQGVMIGNGQVWFDEETPGKMRITTINLDVPEARPLTTNH